MPFAAASKGRTRTAPPGATGELELDLAYVQMKEIFYSPLTLTLGRQDLWFGRGFIIGNNNRAWDQQTLTQATPTIQQLLQSQNQQKALDDFVKDFQKRWKDKTDCRSGFVTQDCKNAPKPKATNTVAPGRTSISAGERPARAAPVARRALPAAMPSSG